MAQCARHHGSGIGEGGVELEVPNLNVVMVVLVIVMIVMMVMVVLVMRVVIMVMIEAPDHGQGTEEEHHDEVRGLAPETALLQHPGGGDTEELYYQEDTIRSRLHNHWLPI